MMAFNQESGLRLIEESEAHAATLNNLRKWNIGLAVLHAVQGIAILVVSDMFSIPVTVNYPAGPPGTPLEMPSEIFDLPIGPLVAVFLFLAALDHGLMSSLLRDAYERDLNAGINKFRWIEYGISATLMIILIASYAAITDISALLGIIGANVGMINFGWLQEMMNPPGRAETTMLPFWFGTLSGMMPWVAIWVNVGGAGTVPDFVYAIVIVEQVLFFSFGVNQWLQYERIGPWKDYLYGEKVYLVLSLVAKSILAWLIYGGSLSE